MNARFIGMLLLPTGALLSACAGNPPTPVTDAAAGVSRDASPFERRQEQRARQLAKSGSHREAALAWEVLSLFDPSERRYQDEMRSAQRRADAEASSQLGKARRARAAGNERQAVRHYLLALTNDPALERASKELRDLERTRNRRYFLGRSTRLTIGRPDDYLTEPPAPSRPPPRPPAPVPQAVDIAPDSNALEHAELLRRDGEFTEALAMLTRYFAANPDDREARRQLAETWEEFGDKSLRSGRLRAALRAFERAKGYAGDGGEKLGAKIDALKRSLGDAS
ncbi:MAG: tetratricopeptide repeat protein [Rhodocyclaceae bacterium]|nr:tetratricopeptide repeat protein [Rhodocyclaceae bacterium]